MKVFEEHGADGRCDVARYVCEARSSVAGTLAALRRFALTYFILAQLSVVLPLTGILKVVAGHVFPDRLDVVLLQFWQRDPKCVTFAVVMSTYLLYRSYPVTSQSESFLVMRSLGVQTTSRGTSRFIPTEEVRIRCPHVGIFLFVLAILTPGRLKTSSFTKDSRDSRSVSTSQC